MVSKELNFVKRLVRLGSASQGFVVPTVEVRKGNLQLDKEYVVIVRER